MQQPAATGSLLRIAPWASRSRGCHSLDPSVLHWCSLEQSSGSAEAPGTVFEKATGSEWLTTTSRLPLCLSLLCFAGAMLSPMHRNQADSFWIVNGPQRLRAEICFPSPAGRKPTGESSQSSSSSCDDKEAADMCICVWHQIYNVAKHSYGELIDQ